MVLGGNLGLGLRERPKRDSSAAQADSFADERGGKASAYSGRNDRWQKDGKNLGKRQPGKRQPEKKGNPKKKATARPTLQIEGGAPSVINGFVVKRENRSAWGIVICLICSKREEWKGGAVP